MHNIDHVICDFIEVSDWCNLKSHKTSIFLENLQMSVDFHVSVLSRNRFCNLKRTGFPIKLICKCDEKEVGDMLLLQLHKHELQI